MKNNNLTNLDTNQIIRATYEEDKNAQRVILIDQNLTIDSDQIVKAIKEGLKDINSKEIERPIHIVVEKYYPTVLKVTAVIQAIGVICILLMNFFRK